MTLTPEADRNAPARPGAVGADSWKVRLLWLAAGLVAVGVLSVTASYAPTALKRLVLFHVLYGVACSMVLLWLAEEVGQPRRAWTAVAAALLCMAGAINMGWLSFQHFARARQEYAAAHPRDAVLQSTLQQLSASDPVLKARYEEEERRVRPRFGDFLTHRVSGLGTWPVPWPQLFWSTEVLLAGLVCGGVFRLRSPRPRPMGETGEPSLRGR